MKYNNLVVIATKTTGCRTVHNGRNAKDRIERIFDTDEEFCKFLSENIEDGQRMHLAFTLYDDEPEKRIEREESERRYREWNKAVGMEIKGDLYNISLIQVVK